MHISILHNCDHDFLADDPGREARKDVTRVAAALSHALTRDGTTAEPIAVESENLSFTEALVRRQPILVVNLCESLAGDSRGEMAVPCLLELLGLPYTGSPGLALGLALHKDKAKELLRARSVPTPEFAVVRRVEDIDSVELPFPLIVKPVREDASVGVDFDSVVTDRAGLRRAASQVLDIFRQPALIERYIEGREIYVPLLGNGPRQTLPLTEIQFGKAFADRPKIVSYRAKWDLESPECIDSASSRPRWHPSPPWIAATTAGWICVCPRMDNRTSSTSTPTVISIRMPGLPRAPPRPGWTILLWHCAWWRLR